MKQCRLIAVRVAQEKLFFGVILPISAAGYSYPRAVGQFEHSIFTDETKVEVMEASARHGVARQQEQLGPTVRERDLAFRIAGASFGKNSSDGPHGNLVAGITLLQMRLGFSQVAYLKAKGIKSFGLRFADFVDGKMLVADTAPGLSAKRTSHSCTAPPTWTMRGVRAGSFFVILPLPAVADLRP